MHSILFGLVCCLFLAGCAHPKHSIKTLNYCLEAMPEGLDAARHEDALSYLITSALYQNLIKDTGYGFDPDAAKFTISDDGRVYTFTLKEGISFHTTGDFTPTRHMNSDDVILTLGRLIDPNEAINLAHPAVFTDAVMLDLAHSILRIDKVDEMRVRITLRKPNEQFLSYLARPMAHLISKEYTDQLLAQGKAHRLDVAPVGSGSFLLEAQNADQLTLVRHIEAMQPAALDRIRFLKMGEWGSRTQGLIRGVCDVARLPSVSEVIAAKKAGNMQIYQGASMGTGFVALDVTRGILTDPQVRRALDMALDKEALNQAVLGTQETLARTLLPLSLWRKLLDNAYPAPEGAAPLSIFFLGHQAFDQASARDILEARGLLGAQIQLWYPPTPSASQPNPKLTAELIKAAWGEVGLVVTLVTHPPDAYPSALQSEGADAVLMGATDKSAGAFFARFGCQSVSLGVSHYCRHSFDEVFYKAQDASAGYTQSLHYINAQRLLDRDTPIISLWHPDEYALTTHKVMGFHLEGSTPVWHTLDKTR